MAKENTRNWPPQVTQTIKWKYFFTHNFLLDTWILQKYYGLLSNSILFNQHFLKKFNKFKWWPCKIRVNKTAIYNSYYWPTTRLQPSLKKEPAFFKKKLSVIISLILQRVATGFIGCVFSGCEGSVITVTNNYLIAFFFVVKLHPNRLCDYRSMYCVVGLSPTSMFLCQQFFYTFIAYFCNGYEYYTWW